MKTADLDTTTVYRYMKSTYGSNNPVLVVEARLWTEKDTWPGFNSDRKKMRVLRRSEKGTKVGSGRRGYSADYKMTGVPVLILGASDYSFRTDADDDQRIVDSPLDLLKRAREQHKALELVDTEKDVFEGGREFRRFSVDALYADGKTRSVTVEFEVVLPQAIKQPWDDFLREEAVRLVQEADWAKQKADKRQTALKQAEEVSRRVTALTGDEGVRFDHNGERYDVRRKHDSSSTYEISYELLLKLIGMAEGSSTE